MRESYFYLKEMLGSIIKQAHRFQGLFFSVVLCQRFERFEGDSYEKKNMKRRLFTLLAGAAMGGRLFSWRWRIS